MPFSLGFARAKQDEPKRDEQRQHRASKPHIVRKTPSTKLWEVTQAITVHTVMGAVEAQPGDLLIANEWGVFVGKGTPPNLEQMSDVPRGTRLSGALAGICMCLLLMAGSGMAQPSQINILGQTWRVSVVKKLKIDGDTYAGQTLCMGHLILLRKRNAEAMAVTLIHELLHAIACDGADVNNAHYNNLTADHMGIYWAAPRLFRLLVDNPDLLSYLRQFKTEQVWPLVTEGPA